jgi:hypothetical protein
MSCAPTWLDHPTSTSLQRELIDKSRKGLALAKFEGHEFSPAVRYFDGQIKSLKLACCSRTEGITLSHGRFVMVDMTSSPFVHPLVDPEQHVASLPKQGGQVVVIDTNGSLVLRSDLWINSGIVALSPDRDLFAFVGRVRGHPPEDVGVYIAGFHDSEARKLMNLTLALPYDHGIDVSVWTTLDWSPRGEALLLSYRGSIYNLDIATARSRKIADGGVAKWSPSGDSISYVTLKAEPALLNRASGETRLIDSRHETNLALEWSPDGEYVLVREGEGSHVPYGCLWVYRVSDGAWAPILWWGIGGPSPQWIQFRK